MLFNPGTYKHSKGFEVYISETGKVLLSPNHPATMRVADLFDITQWSVENPVENVESEVE